jgi:hypothetical protein
MDFGTGQGRPGTAEALLACDFFETVTLSGERDGKFPGLFDAILADAASRWCAAGSGCRG